MSTSVSASRPGRMPLAAVASGYMPGRISMAAVASGSTSSPASRRSSVSPTGADGLSPCPSEAGDWLASLTSSASSDRLGVTVLADGVALGTGGTVASGGAVLAVVAVAPRSGSPLSCAPAPGSALALSPQVTSLQASFPPGSRPFEGSPAEDVEDVEDPAPVEDSVGAEAPDDGAPAPAAGVRGVPP